MKRVEFYYDLVSPYSYLAWGEVTRICEERGAELELKPILLGAVHKAVGLQAPIEIEPKARYQTKDIRRWAGHYDLPLDFPNPFPFRTLKTMRAATSLKNSGDLEAFTRAAFELYWEQGGAPRGTDEAEQGLKDSTSGALERGVFGAPAFFVGGELFWGNDRLGFVEAALRDG